MMLRRRGARRIDPTPARHRWRRRALALLVVSGCASAAVVWQQGGLRIPEPDFTIRTLRVESTFERVSRDEVAAVVRPYTQNGFFKVDINAVQAALVAMPWIHGAAVRRIWPDTLDVVLAEKRPAARWGDSGLVSEEGEVFYPERPQAAGAGLPLLEGPPRTSGAVLAYFHDVSDELSPLGLRVARLSLDARRAWEITLDNGLHLTLGRREADQQLRRFVRFYPTVVAGHAADVIEVDLRYTNGFAVRWRGGSAPPMQAAKKTGDTV